MSEWFRWGAHGGYGAIARSLAEGLARRGHLVSALVPKRTSEAKRLQPDVEEVGGVTVYGIPHSYAGRLLRRELYRAPGAELFVSVDARFDSWLAMVLSPRARHCIWFVDPMDFETFFSLHDRDPARANALSRLATRAVFQTLQHFGRRAVGRADALLAQPRDGAERAARIFGARREVAFAPNPVEIPDGGIEKASRPLVLFLGRFDWQKQPQAFCELALRMPDVEFVAAGAASDAGEDRALRARFGSLPNLSMPGLVAGDAKDALLRRAWILCNTSLREGLPRSFQEALAYGCAIAAAVDPDRLVSRFGRVAVGRDFEPALRALLEGDAWRALGRAGRREMEDTFASERALDRHEALYRAILDGRPLPPFPERGAP